MTRTRKTILADGYSIRTRDDDRLARIYTVAERAALRNAYDEAAEAELGPTYRQRVERDEVSA